MVVRREKRTIKGVVVTFEESLAFDLFLFNLVHPEEIPRPESFRGHFSRHCVDGLEVRISDINNGIRLLTQSI